MSFTTPIAESDVTSLVSDLALKAPKANPTLTGTVTIPNGAAATDIAAYGQIPQPGTVGGPGKTVFRTGDATPITNTAVIQSDDTLKWTVGANDRWIFQGFVLFTATDNGGSAATADIKTGWSVPASGTMQHGNYGLPMNSFAGYGSTSTGASPSVLRTAAQQATAPAGAAAVTFGQAVAGYYTGGGTGGTVTFQWGQSTANVATLTILKNSILLLWQIA